jgi:hypothetical protein
MKQDECENLENLQTNVLESYDSKTLWPKKLRWKQI